MDYFFASFPKHMDHLVKAEIEDWEFTITESSASGIQFQGEPRDVIEFGLTSPYISRLYLDLARGQAKSEDHVYEGLKKDVTWEKYLTPDLTFKIQTTLIGQKQIKEKFGKRFNNTNFLNLKVKDAACDYLREKFGRRPSIDINNPHQIFYLFVKPQGLEVFYNLYIDLLGLLSARGYRSQNFAAPLRENLAAAIVKETNWNPESEDFGDLMCGSGTLLCEAIIQGGNISPQFLKLERNYSFPIESLPEKLIPADKFNNLKVSLKNQKAESMQELSKMDFKIWVNDLNRKSLIETRESFGNFNFTKRINSFDSDATKFKNSHNYKGVVVQNPPYGKRLELGKEEEKFYYELGEIWKNEFSNSRAYLFTGDLHARKFIRLRTNRRLTFFNGDIECRLFEYLID